MSKKGRVLENSFLYIISSLLVKTIGFLLLPVYTRFLTPEDYGVTNLVNSFNQVATFIVAFSLYSAVVRFYADYKEDREKLKRFYGTVIVFVMISGTTFIVLGIIFKDLMITWFFKGVSFYPIVLISLLSITFVSLHTVHQSIMRGIQQGKKLTKVNLITFAAQLCLNLFFVCIIRLGAVGVLLSSFIINIAYFIFMIIDLKKNNLISFSFDKEILKESLIYSIPLMPHNLSTHIASFASRIFINSSDNLASVGLYSISSQFGTIIDLVQSSVNHAFAPWFYEIMNACDRKSKQEIADFSNVLLAAYSLLYMIIGLFSQEAVILMTNKTYVLSWTVIPIFVIAYSIKSVYYFYVNILFYYKDASRKLFIATITGSLADILLSYYLVPKYGMYGAACSFLIAKVIVVSIVVAISKKYEDIGYRVAKMLKIIVPSLLFMAFGLYLSYTRYMTEFNWSNLAFKTAVLLAYLTYLVLIYRRLIISIFKNSGLKNIFGKKTYFVSVMGWFHITYMFLINKIFKVNKNKAVFKSFGGKSYSDNPKAISEKLKKMNPEYEIVWLFNNPEAKKNLVPYYVRTVKANSLKALWELATSKVWVDNFVKPIYLYKSKEQIYIQTWHGDRDFKRLFNDSPFASKERLVFESKNCNLMVSGSDYGERKYKTAFKYCGEILKQGCPRNDVLVKNSWQDKYFIKKSLNLNNSNMLLYAPTLRREASEIDLIKIIKALELKTCKNWICLIRAHSVVKGLTDIWNNSAKIIDCTHYEDMTELLLITDFLITDYSSSAGDFALLNKPIILYQPDRNEYIKKDRAFYFNMDDSPFMAAQSNEEVLEIIKNIKWEMVRDNCKQILDFYGTVETGEASKKVVEYIRTKSKP